MDYLTYVSKRAFSYGLDCMGLILLAIILIPIEITIVIGIQMTRHEQTHIVPRVVTAAFRDHGVYFPENYEKELLVGVIRARCALGGILYLFGYISLFSAACVGISGVGTGLWMYSFVKMINREMNREPMPMPMPVPVQRILEPMLIAMVDHGDVEPIDLTPWADGEFAWAINGDARHLVRDRNADILANAENPINPLTREPIYSLTRSRINFHPIPD